MSENRICHNRLPAALAVAPSGWPVLCVNGDNSEFVNGLLAWRTPLRISSSVRFVDLQPGRRQLDLIETLPTDRCPKLLIGDSRETCRPPARVLFGLFRVHLL